MASLFNPEYNNNNRGLTWVHKFPAENLMCMLPLPTCTAKAVQIGASPLVWPAKRMWMPMVITAKPRKQRKPKGIAVTPLKTSAYLHFNPLQ